MDLLESFYAVQWLDESADNWASDHETYEALEEATIALKNHLREWPTIEARLVKVEITTKVCGVSL